MQTKSGLVTGIHVDGDWLGMAQMKWVRGKPTVTKVSQKRLSQDYGVSKFFSEHKISAEKFIISFPRHLGTVRFLTLPSKKQAEIEEMVRFEAERFVPYSPEEVLMDYQIITGLENGYSRVMVVIVEKAVVDRYLSVLKGFEPESISLTSTALFNWFINSRKDENNKTCALVNVGFRSADIVITERGTLALTRGVTLNQDGWSEKIIAEITRSLDAYSREQKGNMLEVIILSGAREELTQLVSLMEKEFSLPVEVADAFTGIDASSSLNAKKTDYPGAGWVIPMGLTLQRETGDSCINLLPEHIREKRQGKEKLRKYVATSVLSVIAILLLVSVALHAVGERTDYLQLLKRENRAMQPLVFRIDGKRRQLDIIREQLNSGSECLQVLSELHRIIPENISLSGLTLDVSEGVILRGQAKELSEVFTLNSLLEQSSLFENVSVKYANKKRIRRKEITDFSIHCLVSR